ncbi:fibrinolytic enzyme, isozyme C-like [Mya arenaria]|uniref:fibrinolytic enzyme, isozyme C-like n=1 Tax=Mya arenaria TaxID=6604 RepID=UPI0022DEE27C|nr:fibrinolytic enzyme, isozyme C-like [Mya arenaria]
MYMMANTCLLWLKAGYMLHSVHRRRTMQGTQETLCFVLLILVFVHVRAPPPARIINGEDAAPGSHPHQVALHWDRNAYYGISGQDWRFVCGGSVIGVRVILTAAHCVDFAPDNQFRVVINDHVRNVDEGAEQIIGVDKIILHEQYVGGLDYTRSAYPNDIAILVLAADVGDTSTIIPLDDGSSGDRVDEKCVISGWGRNDTDGDLPLTLQEREMTVLAEFVCTLYWGSSVFAGHICVYDGSNSTTGGSACNGDSGGPLVCGGRLAGVTSWGIDGCRLADTGEFLPSVYARVTYYLPWIEITLKRFTSGRG